MACASQPLCYETQLGRRAAQSMDQTARQRCRRAETGCDPEASLFAERSSLHAEQVAVCGPITPRPYNAWRA